MAFRVREEGLGFVREALGKLVPQNVKQHARGQATLRRTIYGKLGMLFLD